MTRQLNTLPKTTQVPVSSSETLQGSPSFRPAHLLTRGGGSPGMQSPCRQKPDSLLHFVV